MVFLLCVCSLTAVFSLGQGWEEAKRRGYRCEREYCWDNFLSANTLQVSLHSLTVIYATEPPAPWWSVSALASLYENRTWCDYYGMFLASLRILQCRTELSGHFVAMTMMYSATNYSYKVIRKTLWSIVYPVQVVFSSLMKLDFIDFNGLSCC